MKKTHRHNKKVDKKYQDLKKSIMDNDDVKEKLDILSNLMPQKEKFINAVDGWNMISQKINKEAQKHNDLINDLSIKDLKDLNCVANNEKLNSIQFNDTIAASQGRQKFLDYIEDNSPMLTEYNIAYIELLEAKINALLQEI